MYKIYYYFTNKGKNEVRLSLQTNSYEQAIERVELWLGKPAWVEVNGENISLYGAEFEDYPLICQEIAQASGNGQSGTQTLDGN